MLSAALKEVAELKRMMHDTQKQSARPMVTASDLETRFRTNFIFEAIELDKDIRIMIFQGL